MLSRVADSIYWMSRYLERAENIARFMDVNSYLALDLPGGEQEQWEPLIMITGDLEAFQARFGQAQRRNVIQFLTFDLENPNSVYSCVQAARENARGIRDSITAEMWEQLNRLYLMVRDASRRPGLLEHPQPFFEEVKNQCLLFTGLTDSVLAHGEGWHFLRMGRLLERADQTSRLLDVKYFILLPAVDYVGTPFDNIQWGAVLKSASALEMYRRRFHRISPAQVVEFLLFDPEFPRAILYCVLKAEQSLREIIGGPGGPPRTEAEQSIGRLLAELEYADVSQVFEIGVHEYLDELQQKLILVGNAVFQTFFALRPSPEQHQSGPGQSQSQKAAGLTPASSPSQAQSQQTISADPFPDTDPDSGASPQGAS